MNTFLKLAFLFFIGSSLGWVLELLFRRFLSGNNPERKWINPGFMVGPYVPLYGTGLCILYLVSRLAESRQGGSALWNNILMLLLMAAAMTAIEYIAGIMTLKVMHARLWDYSRRWGNIDGLICPLFSAIWAQLTIFLSIPISCGRWIGFPAIWRFPLSSGCSLASLPSTLFTPRI